jgi:hypothetical protein
MGKPKFFTGPLDKLELSGTKGKEKMMLEIKSLLDLVHMYANYNGMEELTITIKAGLMKSASATISFKIDDDFAEAESKYPQQRRD